MTPTGIHMPGVSSVGNMTALGESPSSSSATQQAQRKRIQPGAVDEENNNECEKTSAAQYVYPIRRVSSADCLPHSLGSVENEPLIMPGVNDGDCRESWKQTNLVPPPQWCSSKASLSSSLPLCRICHVESTSSRDPLVSPCRCSGSLLYVHRSCLVHWLEISTRKMVPAPRCELCGYYYQRTTFLSLRSFHFPKLETRDKLLNLLFVVAFTVMLICASLSIHFLQVSEQYHATIRGYRVVSSALTHDDVTVIICSILFFTAFFTAVFTQYRAEASIFRLCFRFWVINRNWTIKNYDIQDDPEMLAARRARSAVSSNTVRRPSPKVPSPSAKRLFNQQLPITVLA